VPIPFQEARLATKTLTREVIPDHPGTEPVLTQPYTLEEAGAFLRLSERAVKRRIDAGDLAFIYTGRRRMVLGRHILKYLDDHEHKPLMRPRRRLDA
jgi:hypothetical protein